MFMESAFMKLEAVCYRYRSEAGTDNKIRGIFNPGMALGS